MKSSAKRFRHTTERPSPFSPNAFRSTSRKPGAAGQARWRPAPARTACRPEQAGIAQVVVATVVVKQRQKMAYCKPIGVRRQVALTTDCPRPAEDSAPGKRVENMSRCTVSKSCQRFTLTAFEFSSNGNGLSCKRWKIRPDARALDREQDSGRFAKAQPAWVRSANDRQHAVRQCCKRAARCRPALMP